MYLRVLARCLLARTLNAAAGVLDAEVLEIDPARTATTARDFLLYCYYGGLVHTGAAPCGASQQQHLYQRSIFGAVQERCRASRPSPCIDSPSVAAPMSRTDSSLTLFVQCRQHLGLASTSSTPA